MIFFPRSDCNLLRRKRKKKKRTALPNSCFFHQMTICSFFFFFANYYRWYSVYACTNATKKHFRWLGKKKKKKTSTKSQKYANFSQKISRKNLFKRIVIKRLITSFVNTTHVTLTVYVTRKDIGDIWPTYLMKFKYSLIRRGERRKNCY